ncbi:DUF4913 domain-containing protein [Nocardia sp. NPDC058658]|uniref:DUF4913 domain-containing protein n=1 Tax=Nocardia sp. NPDC058658 TaxID=3346580 RepID=UPI00365DDC14
MTAPNAPSSAGGRSMPPQFPNFVSFTQDWLLPTISVRLAEANRENTYTWCGKWWAHRSVAVRFAHLHTAFEAMRRSKSGSSLSSFMLSHVDAHLQVILDASNGPLHRCTRVAHQLNPSLPFDPVPAGWFRIPEIDAAISERKFRHHSLFVEQWLLPLISVRIAANNRENQYTWCRQWWRHQAVVVRFAGLHACFEAAIKADDKMAMSSLFTRYIDPTMRHALDAANGPMHRCTPDKHVDMFGLVGEAIPAHWFELPGVTTSREWLGFGPDFRGLAGDAVV